VGIVAADRQVTADAALDRLKTINSLAKSAAELARHAVELERLRLGDPTSIVALQMNEPAQVSVEDARAELEALSRAVGHVNGVNGSGVQQ
jgi:hypothetical protein